MNNLDLLIVAVISGWFLLISLVIGIIVGTPVVTIAFAFGLIIKAAAFSFIHLIESFITRHEVLA